MSGNLLQPFLLGDLKLANRMVMAPMTRNRAERAGTVARMMVTYYEQRAGAGLIVTESTPVSPYAIGYPFTPGIFTDAQVATWRHVTDAVHSAGGHIFVQLQHCGRISHPSLLPGAALPVAPSALRPDGQAITYERARDFVTPRPLETDELPDVVAQFEHAARLALEAGFDGVEIHGGNGYLVDQFLRDGTNLRRDAYGGSAPNRMRLLNEILDAVCEIWPAQRVGVRLTPENGFNSMSDSDPQDHFAYFLSQLGRRGLAYAHVLEGDMTTKTASLDYLALRAEFPGTYIVNNGYDFARAERALGTDAADLVAFGVPFLANPDLVRRYRERLPLTSAEPATFYVGAADGNIDYPFHPVAEADAKAA